uniref:Nuclear receptor domain-containing protein n=1 Tax=Macrostomum lignano TaxID=282301 RepID=A0A1I8J0G5_9PLAT
MSATRSGGGGGGSCRICGDRGAGAHYGVVTCVACKSFFKRTVQQCLTYRCEQNGSCQIHQATRRLCQACRFQRCLRCGMRTDLVRSLAADPAEASSKTVASVASPSCAAGGGASSSAAMPSPESSATSTNSAPPVSFDGGELGDAAVAMETDPLLCRLAEIEPAEFNIDVSFAAEHWLPEAMRNAIRLLSAADSHAAAMARWVSQLPGLEALAPAERERLFEENWPAPVVSRIAWGSQWEPDGQLRVCANLQLTNAPESAPRVLQTALTEALRLTRKLRHQRISRSEYLVLKPLLFLCSQEAALRDRAEPLMDPYLRLFRRVCPNRERRMSLLLLSGGVSCVRVQASAFWRWTAARDGHALPPLLAAALRGLVRLRYYWPT